MLTGGVSINSEYVFVAAVREHTQQRLHREADLVLLLQRNVRVNANAALLARIHDSGRSGQKETGRKQLQRAPATQNMLDSSSNTKKYGTHLKASGTGSGWRMGLFNTA